MFSIFATYPGVTVISSPMNLDNTSLVIEGWLGTSARIEVNGNVVESSYLFSNTDITSISLDSTIDQTPIDIDVGERFNFVHNAQSEISYNIVITDAQRTTSLFDYVLTSGISPDFKFDSEGTYIILDQNTGSSKTISVNYGLIRKTIDLEPNVLSDGINSVSIVSTTQSSESENSESTFSFEKYQNSITFESDNVSSTTSITGKVTAENLNDNFYYILNQEGFVPNCGSYAANRLDFTANGDEITIRGMQEGENVVRIIATSEQCDTISGEYRFTVLVDRVAPRLNLIEAFYGRVGTTDSGEYSPDVFDDNEIYSNEDEITLFYDSSDIARIEYILNGRDEGLLINEEIIDREIPQIQHFFVESDGNTLDITLQPFSEYVDSFVLWSYDRIENREEDIRNGEITFSIDLKESRVFSFEFHEGDGPDVMSTGEVQIYDLAFQEQGEVEVIDEVDERGLYKVELDLENGENNVTFLAYDQSGNVAKVVKTIYIDTEDPKLVDKNNFNPKPGSTVHFPIQELNGQVSKEDVYIEVFTIPEGEQVFDLDSDGRTTSLTCKDYEDNILRGIKDLNRQRPRSTTLNLQEIQVDISLQKFFINKESTRSDSNGNFEVYINLEEESYNQGDLNDENDLTIDRSTSTNKVCILMADKFGNVKVEDFTLTLDTGNSLWKEAEITTTPNSIYAAEIEQIGDRRSGSGKVQFSMIARFQYLGSGRVDDISSFRISMDNGRDNDRFQGRGNILQSGVNYVFDKSTNELIAYVPIEISPLGEDPLEYPDEIRFQLQAKVVYTLEDNEIQIDTNPIYFETLINIERPLDHTKWLTPSTIESGLEFINKTIKFTEKATDVMRIASGVSTIACVGYKFIHSACILSANGETDANKKQEAINKCDAKFYNVCDRVAGLESPPSCNIRSDNDDGFTTFSSGTEIQISGEGD